MNATDIVARLEKSRLYEYEWRGVTFSLRLPTQDYLRRIYRGRTANGKEFDEQDAERTVALDAVVDWRGVTLQTITGETGEGADDVVPFDRAVLAAWMDDRIELRDAIVTDVWARVAERHKRREEEAKN